MRADRRRTSPRGFSKIWVSVPLVLLLATCAILGGRNSAHATTQTQAGMSCQDTYTSVALVDGGPENYRIYGQLCGPGDSRSSMVQVLLPGFTYNHYYWNLPYQPENYSYVRHMSDAGYTTFNIDRIGTGNSSHPSSALITDPSNAFVVHQLVQKLRAGQVVKHQFSKVVLVGHSLGTIIGMLEASRYKDVDGFIATGILHDLNLTFVPDLNPLLYPSGLDPRFRDRDLGYLTSRPDARGGPIFYKQGAYDPGALAADEKYAKDTGTALELSLFPVPILDGTTNGIQAPTLVVIGGADEIFCGGIGGADCTNAETVRKHEAPFYPNADLTTFVQPGAGHCINMHYGADKWFDEAQSWLEKKFPLQKA